MNAPVLIAQDSIALPALIDRAAAALINAKTAAEVLEARDMASVAYDAAKKAARLMKAKQAHDELISAVFRAQADALSIEAQAKRRLADEYDAAQERGEQATGRDGPGAGVLNGNAKATASQVGLSRKDIHEAREVRDAEIAEPGIVRRTVDDAIASGEEPTKAKVRRAVKKAAKRVPEKKTRNTRHHPVVQESEHDRDIRPLLGLWEIACERARAEFLKIISARADTPIDAALPMSADQRFEAAILLGYWGMARDIARAEFLKIITADIPIAPATLSMSAQQKFEAAIRQHKRKLDLEFEERARIESMKRLEETILPHYNETYATYQDVIKARKGVMDKATYRKILSCLHADSRKSVTEGKLNEAFHAFTQLEKLVLDEKQSPTAPTMQLPRTYQEMMALKQKVSEERKAKRAASGSEVQARCS